MLTISGTLPTELGQLSALTNLYSHFLMLSRKCSVQVLADCIMCKPQRITCIWSVLTGTLAHPHSIVVETAELVQVFVSAALLSVVSLLTRPIIFV